jgi:hypothetical protein
VTPVLVPYGSADTLNSGVDRLYLMYGINVCLILPPFQVIDRFSFFRYIAFAMHLDIHYVSRKLKQPTNWNRGNI